MQHIAVARAHTMVEMTFSAHTLNSSSWGKGERERGREGGRERGGREGGRERGEREGGRKKVTEG